MLRSRIAIFLAVFISLVTQSVLHADEAKKTVRFLNEWDVPVRELPLVAGSSQAEHWILVFSKWNCQICGMMHKSWVELLGLDPKCKVGIVTLPGITSTGVTQLDRTMLALWRENPQVYEQISTLIWEGGLDPRRLDLVRAEIVGFLGEGTDLDAIERKHAEWINAQTTMAAQMLARIDKGTANAGSFPIICTPEKRGPGHLGEPANYREFLINEAGCPADAVPVPPVK